MSALLSYVVPFLLIHRMLSLKKIDSLIENSISVTIKKLLELTCYTGIPSISVASGSTVSMIVSFTMENKGCVLQ